MPRPPRPTDGPDDPAPRVDDIDHGTPFRRIPPVFQPSDSHTPPDLHIPDSGLPEPDPTSTGHRYVLEVYGSRNAGPPERLGRGELANPTLRGGTSNFVVASAELNALLSSAADIAAQRVGIARVGPDGSPLIEVIEIVQVDRSAAGNEWGFQLAHSSAVELPDLTIPGTIPNSLFCSLWPWAWWCR